MKRTGDNTTSSNTAAPPEARLGQSAGKQRILVVDDEKVMRDLLEMSMARLGYTVTAVADGATALDLLRSNKYDLVMLDVLMPGLDGFAVCTELRQFSDVPVVMLTALNRPDDVVRGLELGADNYVTKPFNFKEVEARIRAILRRSTHQSEGDAFDVAEFGDLRLFNSAHNATVAGRPVELTPTEFSVLALLGRARRATGQQRSAAPGSLGVRRHQFHQPRGTGHSPPAHQDRRRSGESRSAGHGAQHRL